MITERGSTRRQLSLVVALLVAVVWIVGSVLASAPKAFADDTATVNVTVTDSTTGLPVPDAYVGLYSHYDEGQTYQLQEDDSGDSVSFSDVQADIYAVTVSVTGYATGVEDLEVDDATTNNVSIQLVPGNSELHGTLYDASTNQPLDPAVTSYSINVTSDSDEGENGGYTSSGGDSSFSGWAANGFDFTGLGADGYTIQVEADGYVSQSVHVSLGANNDIQNDFYLTPQVYGTISGKVTDTHGAGIVGINYVIWPVNGTDSANIVPGTVNTDGTYSAQVPVGQYTIEFWDGPYYNPVTSTVRIPAYETLWLGGARDKSTGTVVNVTPGSVSANENIELALGGTITGHVDLQASDGSIDTAPEEWPGVAVFQSVAGVWTPVDIPSPYAGDGGPGDFGVYGLPAGSYKIGMIDNLTGPRAFTTQYWNNTATLDAASTISVTSGGSVTGKDFNLVVPRPADAATPVDESELTGGTEHGVDAAATAEQDQTISVDVGSQYSGEWVSTWAHSDPTQIGAGWVQVQPDGTIQTTLDNSVPTGTHKLVVQLADNSLLGWTNLTVTAATSPGNSFTTETLPVITGTAKVGSTLTADPGTWTPSGATFEYQWFANGTAITGATNPTFSLLPAQAGEAITVQVTGTKVGFNPTPEASHPTQLVSAGSLAAGSTAVTGVRAVGQTLTAVPGNWSPVTPDFTYQWLSGGVAVSGATNSTYVQTPADLGKVVSVSVTGAATSYSSATSTSSGSAPKTIAGSLSVPTLISVSAPAVVGSPLTLSETGTWSGGGGTVVQTYQWSANGVAIPGAKSSTYLPDATDVGKALSVAVTGTTAGYNPATVSSSPGADVLYGQFASIGHVKLGLAQARVAVTVGLGSWQPTPDSYSYAWYLNGKRVVGFAGPEFVPVASEAGDQLSVAVTVSRAGYVSRTVLSPPTVIHPH